MFTLLANSPFSRLPLYEGSIDNIVGVVHLKDLLCLRRTYHQTADTDCADVRQVMSPALFIPDSMQADEAFTLLQRKRYHVAIVLDEYGGTAGIVTLEDLIEELLGDISDEHDRDAPETILQEDGSFQVSARLPVDRLGEIFGIELEDDEVDSVGGLVAKYLGRLAETGDVVVVSGIELTARETERKRQRLVTVGARWVGAETGEITKLDDTTERN